MTEIREFADTHNEKPTLIEEVTAINDWLKNQDPKLPHSTQGTMIYTTTDEQHIVVGVDTFHQRTTGRTVTYVSLTSFEGKLSMQFQGPNRDQQIGPQIIVGFTVDSSDKLIPDQPFGITYFDDKRTPIRRSR